MSRPVGRPALPPELKKSKLIQLTLNQITYDKLVKISNETSRPITDLVREALNEVIEKYMKNSIKN